MKIMGSCFLFFLFIPVSYVYSAGGDDIIGRWKTEEKDAIIEIFKCGEKYCGRIVWLKEPNYAAEDKNGREGQPKIDDHNPDPALRNRPVLGIELMRDFAFSGGNSWAAGRIYDPESGKTYSGRLTLVSPNVLKLRGYALISLFGRTTTWTREGR